MRASISLGVTIMVSLSSVLFIRDSSVPAFSRISKAIVFPSTTVGTPMAITGTPRDFSLISLLWFPTPEPGHIPEVLICTVLPNLSVLLEARASITITAQGFMLFATLAIISALSIPVLPKTPGTIPATLRRSPRPVSAARERGICLVARRRDIHFGPKASGVMLSLPSPATRTVPCFSGKRALSSSLSTKREGDKSSEFFVKG